MLQETPYLLVPLINTGQELILELTSYEVRKEYVVSEFSICYPLAPDNLFYFITLMLLVLTCLSPISPRGTAVNLLSNKIGWAGVLHAPL